MALTDPIQTRVQRSIYHALRKEVVRLGYLPDIELYPETNQGNEDFRLAKEVIATTKGYFIDLFGHSSARAKFDKKCPRIVVFMSRIYEGDIGASPAKIWAKDPENNKYKSGQVPAQASNLIFAIHILSNKTSQDVLLNRIVSNVLGQKGFVKYYDEPESDFFIFNSSYNDLEDSQENIIERAYYYTVKDIFMGEVKTDDIELTPIERIDLTIKTNENDNGETITIQ